MAFGRYRLRELVGAGGMGQVFKAHDTVIGRDVAVKVLPPEMASMPGYRERFRREARIAARLTEPHIIPIHDTGEIDGRLYLVMPIVEGVDVHTVLRREGPMTPQRAVRVIEQLAAALNAAHRNGLVHRDIKPSNALMTPDEHVYLIDFGIAHDASATRLTHTGMLVGTFAYMAPERFLTGSVDARADVYSLTCVLHQCLTGATPFPGDSMEQQIAAHLTAPPPRPSAFNAAIPAAFDDVVARGMAKKPDQRYQTAVELASAARGALDSAPAPHRPQPRAPAAPEVRRPFAPTVAGTQTFPHPATPQLSKPPQEPSATSARPVISSAKFAGCLLGVVLVSFAAAGFLTTWADWSYTSWSTIRIQPWLTALAMIPGFALLITGHGRAKPGRTVAGCGIFALGLSALFLALMGLQPHLDRAFHGREQWLGEALAIVGSLLVLLLTYFRRANQALARGCMTIGAAIVLLALVDELLKDVVGRFYLSGAELLYGGLPGAVLLIAGAIAWTLARAGRQPQTASPTAPARR